MVIQCEVLRLLSAVTPPREYVEDILNHFVNAVKSSPVFISMIYVKFLAVLTCGTVVEDKTEGTTCPRGLFLQEPVEYFRLQNCTGYGSVFGLPWR